MHPQDFSPRRYAALLIIFAASIFCWLGPCLSMFILDPMLNLGVASIQVRGWGPGVGGGGVGGSPLMNCAWVGEAQP